MSGKPIPTNAKEAMTEFLVRMSGGPPLSDPGKTQLAEAEFAYGQGLMQEGSLLRIWRLPGRRANISLYEVEDATELHDKLSHLPFWPWLDVRVIPVAQHPLDRRPARGRQP